SVMVAISLLRMGLPILVFMGSYLLAQRSLVESVFLVFIVVASRIYDPFTTLMINYTEMRYALISGERIMEIRNQPEVQGTEELTEDYTIHFKEVSFSYKDEPVLQKINVEIQPRTLTALVGPSG
ncbi:ABC transporter ATP-binding protein, partial [Enterococcus sp. S181_ASV_20]|nr:ABC transporter ATP-binding protein [Enterococcus sp. S181_ASV_20]